MFLKSLAISILFLCPLLGQVNLPNANTTAQAQNVVAGCNANVPTSLCQGGNAANTTSTGAIASGVVTINLVTAMSSAFPVNDYLCISGATVLTQLNGLLLKVNNSTTTTSVVGTLVNTQNAVQTPANVSSTAETHIYLQDAGWQPCYLAPFPAPNTYSCGAQGNGSPTCVNTGTPAAVNSWVAGDWAIKNPNGGAPKLPIVMLTDLNSKSQHSLFGSLSGETNDKAISLSDKGTPPAYFHLVVQGGNEQVTHGHIDSSACGGIPCYINDASNSANWAQPFTNKFDCGFGRSQSVQAGLGVNHAYLYCDEWSNPFAPTYQRCLLTYTAGGSPPSTGTVTSSCTVLYNINTCPAWGYISLGPGVDGSGPTNENHTTQFTTDNFDSTSTFGLGGGTQGTLNRHMMFKVKQGSPNSCATWDSAGMSGTNLYEVSVNSTNQGTGFNPGDTVTFNEGTGICQSTVTVATTNAGAVTAFETVNTTLTGSVSTVGSAVNFTVASDAGMYVGQTLYIDTGANLDYVDILSCGTSTLLANCTSTTINGKFTHTHSTNVQVETQSLNNTGCFLSAGITPSSTSGSGTGLQVDVTGIGNPTSGTVYPYATAAQCPAGNNTTLNCVTGIVPTVSQLSNQPVAPYGHHSGNCEASGRDCYTSGHDFTWQFKAGIGINETIWDTATPTLTSGTNGNFTGHPGIGYGWQGAASYPNYNIVRYNDGFLCSTPPPNQAQCLQIFSYPIACNSNPGGSDNHSHWASLDNGQTYPIDITSTFNTAFTETDPPNWTCGLMSSDFLVKSDGSGNTWWVTHWYQNENNNTENFAALNIICIYAPDDALAICPLDMFSGFTGNTGLGTSSDSSAPFIGLFSITRGITGGLSAPTNLNLTITGNVTVKGNVTLQ